MAMFTFYGDESYGSIDAYAVAGYVATVRQWEELAREWKEIGKQEGFSVLHKRLLEHNVKGSEFEWADLTAEEKAAKKKRINHLACKAILRRVSAGFCAAVTKSVWDSAVSNSRWAGLLGKSFYAAGVYVCLNLIAVWSDQPRSEPIDGIRYIFEEGAVGRDEAERILRELKDEPYLRGRYKMQGFSFEDKKDPDFVPLQAADFLAYEAYRQLDNRVIEGIKTNKHGKPFDARGALKCLLQQDDPRYAELAAVHPDQTPTPHHGLFLDEPKIRGLLDGLERNFPSFTPPRA
jgi:uncharacterized protein DUF3800